ncbi:MAG: hypothetical protein ACI4L9_03760 [Candidatus Coproplasma sp.]
MERDFKNYDYLTVSVKSAQLENILECYYALGWREVKREDDRDYYDMKYIALRRPHKIPNKDRLQLLQVRMETGVNTISSVHARRHQKSGVACSVMLFFALGLLALGLWFFLGLQGEYGTIFGIVCCALFGALTIASAVTVLALHKPEERASAKKIAQTLKDIQTLVAEARSLAPEEEVCNIGKNVEFDGEQLGGEGKNSDDVAEAEEVEVLSLSRAAEGNEPDGEAEVS